MAYKQYEEAARWYVKALELAVDVTHVLDLKVKWGEALYSGGVQSTAVQLFQDVIKEDPEHFNALFAYGKALIDHAEIQDSMPVFLKLLVKSSDNQGVREVLAELVRDEAGLKELYKELGAIPKSPTALAYLAMVVKEYGGIEASIRLYSSALEAEPSNTNYVLNLAHVVELTNDYDRVFNIIKKFCKDNPTLTVGPCSCSKMYNIIRGYATIQSSCETLAIPPLPEPETHEIPLTEMYPPEELDLLALWCTLTKGLYIVGNLELVLEVIRTINPVREGRPMHTTTIRNEVAYHCCIDQLMSYHKLPRDLSLPYLYLAGDSHALVSAYQPIQFQGKTHVIKPMLVTGLKCWHLRPESKFFPKFNFWNVIKSAPHGSHVIFQFGEIDCREGFVLAVQKCIYKDIEEGCLVAINIYIKVLLEVIDLYGYTIYVHPAVPVIDVTRDIVKTFNKVLQRRVLEEPQLRWLAMFEGLLTEDGKKLNKMYELDGTHMNPLYLPLLESAIEIHTSSKNR
eukprot:TRINITY_DN8933_c1_g1_i3.p1 TRINITY_DN8933_c1_g1~~TRINITY_DN8933_c1_g1_i3.p1  ORF type:complete len:511 (-),score=85.71 TRINITY_DN8933_c1_g1_i3:59-1591(-)